MKEADIKLAKQGKLKIPKWVSLVFALISIIGLLNALNVVHITYDWIVSTLLILSYPAVRFIEEFTKNPYVFIACIPMLLVILVAMASHEKEFEKSIGFWSFAIPSLLLFAVLITRANRATKELENRKVEPSD